MQRDLFKGYINNTNNRGTYSKTASKAHKAALTPRRIEAAST